MRPTDEQLRELLEMRKNACNYAKYAANCPEDHMEFRDRRNIAYLKALLPASRDIVEELLERREKETRQSDFDKQYPPVLECMRCEGLGCSLCKEDETV